MIEEIFSTVIKKANKHIKPYRMIFNFHRVTDEAKTWEHFGISPRIFEQQMIFLTKYFNVLSLEDILNLKSGIKTPAVAITFDDGYKDIYQYAYPILKKHKIPATIFIATDFVENRKMFWWDYTNYLLVNLKNDIKIDKYGLIKKDEVEEHFNSLIEYLKNIDNSERNSIIDKLEASSELKEVKKQVEKLILNWNMINEMQKDNLMIGAHTHTHPIASNQSQDELKSEINKNIDIIFRRCGVKSEIFAYPNGKKDDYNIDTISILNELGIKYAFTTHPRFIKKDLNKKDYNYKIGRINASSSLNKFMIQASGVYSLFKRS